MGYKAALEKTSRHFLVEIYWVIYDPLSDPRPERVNGFLIINPGVLKLKLDKYVVLKNWSADSDDKFTNFLSV